MHEEDDDALEQPSKTQRKKEMQALQDLGQSLAEAPAGLLDRLSLPERLRAAIDEYRRLPNSREGKRRQLQFIGRLMRDADAETVAAVLDQEKQNAEQDKRRLHRLEDMRDRLIDGNKELLEELIQSNPLIEAQPLRQLIRQAQKERGQNKPPAASRKLFRYLRDSLQEE